MIREYKDISSGETVGPVDVCIIGSGAGGSVMAYCLARAGLKVAVLEKGGYFRTKELGRREVYQLTRIQAMTIFTPATGKHTRVSLIAGECVGGGTVASESVTWDLPREVREDWSRMGLDSFAPENKELDDYCEKLNKMLSVEPVRMEYHNPCNQIAMIGAEREGLRWKSVDRPVRGCMRCGNCTQGCRYGAKQDANHTFIKWARQKGAVVYSGAEVDKVRVNFSGPDDHPYKQKIKAASARAKKDLERQLKNAADAAPAKFTITAGVTDRKAVPPRNSEIPAKTLTVHAHKVVMAAGPVGDSRILLRSGINPNGVVGKKFTVHPTCFNIGRFDRNVMLRGWDGINDTIEVHHYGYSFRNEPYYDPGRHGFLLESALSLPWGVANLMPGAGAEHLARMRNMNHLAGLEVQLKTDQYGRVTEDGIEFDISERDNEAMLFGAWTAARIMFRAGAGEVYTGLPGLVLKSPAQLDEIFKYKRGKAKGFMQKQANLYTGHLFGGAVMGTDPKDSFCQQTGQCHAVRGLWVADGAAFPTNVGVNCCMSIMQVARKIAADFVRDAKPGLE